MQKDFVIFHHFVEKDKLWQITQKMMRVKHI